MYFEVAAIIAVIIFAILSIYIIRALIALKQTLQRADLLTIELTLKLRQLDSSMKAVANVGDFCETKTALLRENLEKREQAHIENYTDDLADWIFASLKLGTKIMRRN